MLDSQEPMMILLQKIIDECARTANAVEKCSKKIQEQNNYFSLIKEGIEA